MAAKSLRLFAFPAALLVLPALLPGPPAAAAEFSDYTYTVLSDGTVSITGYKGKDTQLELPAAINGAAVTAIGDHAFAFEQDLTAVTLPDSLTSIGDYAFNECTGLLSIDFPTDLVTVGEGAFFSCTRLTEVTLPEGLTTLGTDAFYDCTGLTSVTVPGSVTTFGDHVFENCTSLQTAALGEGLTALPSQTFYDCTALRKVTLPATLRTIGDRAFTHASSLQSITLPAGLKKIGDYAFQESALNRVDTAAAEIGEGAFSGCASLSDLTLREGVQSVGKNAFTGAPLPKAALPASLTKIGTGAFPRAFVQDGPDGEPQDSGLQAYTVADGSTAFAAADGALYNKDQTTLLSVPAAWNSTDGVFTVPDTVTEIAPYAFADCKQIKQVLLPDGLTTLGEYAFSGCTALTKITLPDGVTALPTALFAGCTSLTDVTLGAKTQTIGEDAFFGCTSLQTLALPDTVTGLTGAVFSGCGQAITLTVADTNPTYQFADGLLTTKDGKTLAAYLGGGTAVTLPDTVTALGDNAIVSPAVTAVTLPDSLAKLGKNALGTSRTALDSDPALTPDFVLTTTGQAALTYAAQNELTCFTGTPKANAETAALKAGQTFAFAIENAPASLTGFASADNAIAKVDAKGTVTAVANGSTDIFAVVGQQYFKLHVTVTGGSAPAAPYADYRVFTSREEIDQWADTYTAYNANRGFSQQAEDNPGIVNYSTNNYAYIMACLPGGAFRIPQAEAAFGKNGYTQFKTVAANLHKELSRYQLCENVVAYSGVSDVSAITGTGSTLADMLASVGRTFTTQNLLSTSLDHGVAAGFTGTGHHYMLEIYAPKDGTNGAYIDKISHYAGEQELLLNDGVTLEVLDAGIRQPDANAAPEWYLKLRIVPDTPKPTPTATVSPAPTAAPTATPKPTAAPTPAATPNDKEFYTCPKCGYHNWTATAAGYRCDHCGNVVTLQLNGYPNVKGYTDVAKLTQTPAPTKAPAPVQDPTANTKHTATPAPTVAPIVTLAPTPAATPEAAVTPAPTAEPKPAANGLLPLWLKIALGVLIVGSAAVLYIMLVVLPRKKNTNYHRR